MITNFKIYENMREPQIGDYALVKQPYSVSDDIGKIINLNGKSFGIPTIIVRFNDTFTRDLHFERKDIYYYSENIEDVRTFKETLKYNL